MTLSERKTRAEEVERQIADLELERDRGTTPDDRIAAINEALGRLEIDQELLLVSIRFDEYQAKRIRAMRLARERRIPYRQIGELVGMTGEAVRKTLERAAR